MSPAETLQALHRSLSDIERDIADSAQAMFEMAQTQKQLEEFFRQHMEELKKTNALLEGLCLYLSVKPEELRKYA